MLKLYFYPGVCSMSPHIVLEELGLKYEAIKTDIRNKPAEYLKMNPKGYVPALMTDHGLLTEGPAIVQYLADLKPEANLIPKAGTWERYKAIEMLNFISTELHKGFSPLFGATQLASTPEAQEEIKTFTKKKLGTRFDLLASTLKTQKFLMGDHFTVCDAYAFTVLTWAKVQHIDLTTWPEIMGFMERMQTRPSVQVAMKAEGLKV